MEIDTANNLHESVRAGDDSEDLGVFAYIAFQDRFKWELTNRWQKLEEDAYAEINSAPVAEKYKPFKKFFEDAEVLLAETIREYFQRLLNIAIARPQQLGNVSPLDWTKSHILKEVCAFLGIDEKIDENFEWTSEPRDDSRVLISANRLTEIAGLEGKSSSEFLLPRWIYGRHPAWALANPESCSASDARLAAERMSRAETTQWCKYTEFLITRKIALQIKKDDLDSRIDAGAPGKSVNLILEVFTPETPSKGNTIYASPLSVQPVASLPSRSDRERLGAQFAVWDDELRRISKAAQAKRRYSEDDARADFPDFTLWKAIDASNLSTGRRRELFESPGQTFGLKAGRFELIGEVTGRSSFTAYDIYKDRPDRKQRPRKH